MKVKFYTLGCKVNQYESQAIGESLRKRGYEIVDGKDSSDVVIVNSCTVTAESDRKTRQAVRRFKRQNPHGIVVLTGCMPQAYPDKAKELLEADIVLGNKNNKDLPDILENYIKYGSRAFEVKEHQKGDCFCGDTITAFEERTRAYIKIQDGCNRFCSYCVIPYARGRVRSKPLDELKTELENISANGYKEVVLVGINLSSYGSDIGCSFPEAVKVANDTDGILRVRLGSLEPDHLTDEVIEELSKCEKLCPQFHISLQSGCDSTLKRMNRHYDTADYRRLCKKLRECFADCTLTTDIMVGFAGESDEDFETSLSFMEEIGFEKVHVFPYSIRKGTRAEKLEGHLDKKIKEDRCKIMIDKAEEIRRSFFSQQVGKTYSIIIESKSDNDYYTGYTANYIPVKVKLPNGVNGSLVDIKIVEVADEDYLIGEII